MLPAVDFGAVFADSILVLENKRNFNDSGKTRAHEGVSKDRVDHGGHGQGLRVRRHCESSEKNDDAWNQIPLRSAVPASTQPDADKTRAPPHNAHGGVLQVVVHPRSSPPMFRKRVDAAPCRDGEGIEEFLAPSGPPQP